MLLHGNLYVVVNMLDLRSSLPALGAKMATERALVSGTVLDLKYMCLRENVVIGFGSISTTMLDLLCVDLNEIAFILNAFIIMSSSLLSAFSCEGFLISSSLLSASRDVILLL